MTQFWKLPFRKAGYPAETIVVSTTEKIVGDYILLPRKFFRLEGTVIQYLDPKDGQYKNAALSDTGSPYLIARELDSELTEALGVKVYIKLQLNNLKVTNTQLKITYQPFGDILDPSDFQQSLTPSSDVVHNSLTLESTLTSQTASISKELTVSNVRAEGGTFDTLFVKDMKVAEVQIGDETQKLTYKNGLLEIKGNTFPHINPKNLLPLKLLVLSPQNAIEITPITWLSIDPVKSDLRIQDTNILEAINALKAEVKKLKGE